MKAGRFIIILAAMYLTACAEKAPDTNDNGYALGSATPNPGGSTPSVTNPGTTTLPTLPNPGGANNNQVTNPGTNPVET